MTSSKPTLAEISAKLKELDALTPGITQAQFEELSGFSKPDWQDASGKTRFDELRVTCGLATNRPDVDLEVGLRGVCALVTSEKYRRRLTLEELMFERRHGLKIPIHSTLLGAGKKVPSLKWTRGRKIEGFWEVVAEFASQNPEFNEAAQILGIRPSNSPVVDQTLGESLSQDDFVPPIVRSLCELAGADGGANPKRLATEFEQRVGHAFKVMGMDVDYLGGSRVADGIAKTPRVAGDDAWAVIYDAKRYVDGYKLNTDDERALKEYAQKHGNDLKAEGFDRRYFVYVAGKFKDSDEKKAESLKHDLGDAVQQVVFLEVGALVRIVEKRLSEGRQAFTNKEIGRLFRTGIVREDDKNLA